MRKPIDPTVSTATFDMQWHQKFEPLPMQFMPVR
jgi:hypothetical protein